MRWRCGALPSWGGAAVNEMQRTQPNYAARELADVHVPVLVVQGEHDEFITRQHAEHLARSVRGAELIVLPDVSHFAPLQRPRLFNDVLRLFVSGVLA
jgi:pimeloyl-ACP methyl ester carboxylesterase